MACLSCTEPSQQDVQRMRIMCYPMTMNRYAAFVLAKIATACELAWLTKQSSSLMISVTRDNQLCCHVATIGIDTQSKQ